MPLARTAKWDEGMLQAGVANAIRVQITLNGVTRQYCKASQPLKFDGSNLATESTFKKLDVAGGYRHDALTRKGSLSQVTLTFEGDQFLRTVLSQNLNFNAAVQITTGPESMASTAGTDYLPVWAGGVIDLKADKGLVKVVCSGISLLISGTVQNYSAVNKHPLQALSDLLTFALGPPNVAILSGGNVPNWTNMFGQSPKSSGVFSPPTSLVDVGSLDPGRLQGGTYPQSHFNLTRAIHDGIDRHVGKPQEISPMIDELVMITGGILREGEDGLLHFVPYDPASGPTDNWDLGDFDEISPDGANKNLINHVAVRSNWDGQTQGLTIIERQRAAGSDSVASLMSRFRKIAWDGQDSSGGYGLAVIRDDLTSQIGCAYPGQSARVVPESVESKFLGAASNWFTSDGTAGMTSSLPGPGATFEIAGGWVSAFCGVPRRQNVGAGNPGTVNTVTWYGGTAFPGQVPATGWFNVNGLWFNTSNAGAPSLAVYPPGTVQNVPPLGPVAANDQAVGQGLVSGRVAYVQIDNEIIAVSAYVVDQLHTALGGPDQFGDSGEFAASMPRGAPQHVTAVVLQRGALGTTPAAHVYTQGNPTGPQQPGQLSGIVHDVTIESQIAQRITDRFPNGCPEFTVKAKLHKGWLCEGDTVTLPNDVFLALGLNGIDNTTEWEILGKEPNLTDDTKPHYRFRLGRVVSPPAYARIPLPPSGILTPPTGGTPSGVTVAVATLANGGTFRGSQQSTSGSLSDVVQPAIAAGGAVTLSGLTLQIGPAAVSRPGLLINHPGLPPTPLPPNLDHYVYWDQGSHSWAVKSVANGAAAPTLVAGMTPHSMHSAGATAASQKLDQRNLGATTAGSLRVPSGSAFVASPQGGGANAFALIVDKSTTNSIANPSFENNVTDGWSVIGGITVAQSVAHFCIGTASAALSVTNTASDQGLLSAMVPSVQNDIWFLSAYAACSASGKSLRLRITYYASDRITVLRSDTSAALAISPTSVLTFVRFVWEGSAAPSGTAFAAFSVLNDGTANGAFTIYYDNVQAEQNIFTSSYCDGDIGPGYEWTGTPRNSASIRTAGLHPIGSPTVGFPFYVYQDGSLRVAHIKVPGNPSVTDEDDDAAWLDITPQLIQTLSNQGYVYGFVVQNGTGGSMTMGSGNSFAGNGDVAAAPVAGHRFGVGLGSLFSYQLSATFNLTANTVAICNFASQVFDTHSDVTTGASWHFTAPEAGYYLFTARCTLSPSTDGQVCQSYFFKNGAEVAGTDKQLAGTAGGSVILGGEVLLKLAANDTVDFRILSSQTIAGGGGSATATENWIMGMRVA